MKHKSTILAFALAMLPAGYLSAWDLPTEPAAPVVTSADLTEVIEAEDTVYLFNVAAAQYFTCGNSWGTEASLGMNPLKIILQEHSETFADYDLEVTGVGIFFPGQYDASHQDTYLFRDNQSQCFVDDNGRANTVWDFDRVGDYYRIRIAAENPTYGFDTDNYEYEWLGWNGVAGNSVVNANIDPDEEGVGCDWAILRLAEADQLSEAIAAYNARLALYATLERAQEVNADAADVLTLYNNPNATSEQLVEANSALKSAIDRAYYEQKWDEANEDNPMDVTDDCLVNPAFDDGNINGWLCTFKSGVNATDVGYQNNQAYQNGDSRIDGFIQAWRAAWGDSQAVIGDGELSQTLYGLPQGRYVLSADVISVHQNNSSYNPVKGVYLFIKSGRFEERISVATGNERPQHFEVEFLNEGADEMTFGLRSESCNANWIAADNFRIEYYGKMEKSIERTMLEKAIRDYEDDGNDYCNYELYSAYTDALGHAEELVESGSDEECLSYIDVLQEKYQAVVASRADYEELDKVYDHINNMAALLSENNAEWNDLIAQLEALAKEVETQLEDLTADAAYLAEVTGKDKEIVTAYIADGSKIKPGDDLTVLLDNADFQTTDPDITKVPGWVGSVKELSKAYGDIEVYCMSANLEQVLKNMPMGAYDITVQGFVRGNNEKVKLYAGDSKTTFKNIMDEYALEPSFGTMEERQANIDNGNVWPFDNGYTLDDGTEVYRPHSMQGAAAAFAKENEMTGEPFYTNHCRIVLTKAGDMAIGINVEFASGDPELWVIWDNFRIKYAGNEASMYADEIFNRQDAVRKALEAEGAVITNEAQRKADAAIKAGDDALLANSVDDCIAAMRQLEEAEAYANEGAALSHELASVAEFYVGMLETVYSSDQEYYDFVTMVYEQEETEFESNESIQEAIDYIRNGWAAYVMYDVKDLASTDSPEDVTPIIYNSDYIDPITLDYSANGWTITTDGGTNTANEGALECFNNNTFDVNQSLVGLAPGYYLLGVSGFYRPGAAAQLNDSLATVCHAMFYAETSEGTFEQPMLNIIDGAQEETQDMGREVMVTLEDETELYVPDDLLAAKFYQDLGYYVNEQIFQVGEDGKATIGIRKNEYIAQDWTIFSTWTLAYMGTEPPVAVKGIQADGQLSKANVGIYDLTGRRVQKAQKGIYIVNGRKVAVTIK